MHLVFCLFLLFSNAFGVAQANYDVRAGISINVGNKLTRIGITGGGYANYN